MIARLRDAWRVLRGKNPKHSAVAKHYEWQQHVASTRTAGISTESDVKLGALTPEELALFRKLVREARDTSGPIVQFGTLLGETVVSFCRWKRRDQRVYTIDPSDANPWNLDRGVYRALVRRVLKFLLNTGHVVHLSTRPRDFFTMHGDEPPALVFINHVRSRDEACNIIRWAKQAGAQMIAGRGYDFAMPAIVKAVDEFGGPDMVDGSVWRLKQEQPGLRMAAHTLIVDRGVDGGLVSIIVPAYNARDYIEIALESVSRQLYRAWELVVVEDGSAEDVEAITEAFQRRHPSHRIVYQRNPQNCGVSCTRNNAMPLCEGEYVAFLDADDSWAPDHLQRKVRLLETSGGDLAYSSVEAFDDQSDQTLGFWGPGDADLQMFPESMFGRPYLQPSSVVVRRTLLEDVGKFDENLDYAEDYDYWFRAIALGKRFCFDNKVTSRYRKNHESAATSDRLVLCCEGIAEVTSRHLKLLGVNDAERRRIVSRHYLMAGTGHLAFAPTPRNGCNPATGQECLRQAWKLGERKWGRLGYYLLARATVATGTTPVVRRFFRKKYKRYVA
jgi:glycosyltransferase involved in cell wall biosynthesis